MRSIFDSPQNLDIWANNTSRQHLGILAVFEFVSRVKKLRFPKYLRQGIKRLPSLRWGIACLMWWGFVLDMGFTQYFATSIHNLHTKTCFFSAQFNVIFEFGDFLPTYCVPTSQECTQIFFCTSVTQQRIPKLFVNGFPTHHSTSPAGELEKIKIKRFIIPHPFPTPSPFLSIFLFDTHQMSCQHTRGGGGGSGGRSDNPAVSHTKVAHYNNNRGGPFWYGKLTRVTQPKKEGGGDGDLILLVTCMRTFLLLRGGMNVRTQYYAKKLKDAVYPCFI